MRNLKGWRTIVANVAIAGLGVAGYEVDPEFVNTNIDAIFGGIAAINMLLRLVTTTPVGEKE